MTWRACREVKATAGNVLVVGHSGIGAESRGRARRHAPVTLGETDYDNLFIVIRDATLRMPIERR